MKLRITIEREDDKPDRYGWKEEYQQIVDESDIEVKELVSIINRYDNPTP